MKTILAEDIFNIISAENKEFILGFNDEIIKLGYDFGDNIGSGFCWGKYMIVYSKSCIKSKQVAARIYIRENSIVLRLFLNKIDKHCKYIENANTLIKEAFTGDYGKCNHCHEHKGRSGICRFRKTYYLENKLIEKCSGITFEFWEPNLEKLPYYIDLLSEFYPVRR